MRRTASGASFASSWKTSCRQAGPVVRFLLAVVCSRFRPDTLRITSGEGHSPPPLAASRTTCTQPAAHRINDRYAEAPSATAGDGTLRSSFTSMTVGHGVDLFRSPSYDGFKFSALDDYMAVQRADAEREALPQSGIRGRVASVLDDSRSIDRTLSLATYSRAQPESEDSKVAITGISGLHCQRPTRCELRSCEFYLLASEAYPLQFAGHGRSRSLTSATST